MVRKSTIKQTLASYMLTIVLHEQSWNCMMCGDSIATVQNGIITTG